MAKRTSEMREYVIVVSLFGRSKWRRSGAAEDAGSTRVHCTQKLNSMHWRAQHDFLVGLEDIDEAQSKEQKINTMEMQKKEK